MTHRPTQSDAERGTGKGAGKGDGRASDAHAELSDPTTAGNRFPQPREVVENVGGHVSSLLDLDLSEPDDRTLGRWLLAAALHEGRQAERITRDACERLRDAALFDIEPMANAAPVDVERLLAQAQVPKAENVAPRLIRIARALHDGYRGSIERLAGEAEGLEELAMRLSKLTRGFGRAGVVRYLTPIRSLWHVASDLPSTPAVCAAAADLGLVDEHQDPASVPASLARKLGSDAERETPGESQPSLRDFEAALDRLGRAACLRGRVDRCPLGDACPRRPPSQ